VRVLCFPHAGGGASLFRSWRDAVPAGIQLCPIQLPGREHRIQEPPCTRLDVLVETLVDTVASAITGRFALFGHSMGALIAFELACRLRHEGVPPPVALLVCGHRAPHLPDRRAATHHLPDPLFLAEIRRLSGTPDEVFANTELTQLMLDQLRADFRLCETYVYRAQSPLSCPIVALCGTEDRLVSGHELAAWRTHTTGSFEVRMVTGDHFVPFRPGSALPSVVFEWLQATASRFDADLPC
jgi:medium-chain acyl-[acyl-carrier-protein] hydrolase